MCMERMEVGVGGGWCGSRSIALVQYAPMHVRQPTWCEADMTASVQCAVVKVCSQ